MAVALEQFVKQLADSGVIAPGKLENFVPPKAHPKDVQELARQLVQQKHLTRFQAQEIYLGRAKSLLLGNYTLLDKIGAGGMGQVFKAEHRRMKRLVAIKMLPKAVTKDAAAVARFQREVEAAAKLEHPNIVTAYDADQSGDVHFLVMQYVEGSDLAAIVKKNGPLPVAQAVGYILQAARGLEYAHQHGVIHRDIKPANLLLSTEGTVKILDMGLARLSGPGDTATQAELTGTGAIMGTVDYMAPEQALSTKHADVRADIYSLGCTLCYLLTGQAIYDGETLMAKLLAHREGTIPDLRKIRPELPPPVEAVFRKMVAKRVEDRYQSLSEVVADLEQCSSRQPTSTGIRPPTTEGEDHALTFLKEGAAHTTHQPSPTTKTAARNTAVNKNLLLATVGVGLAGLVVLAVVISRMSGPEPPSRPGNQPGSERAATAQPAVQKPSPLGNWLIDSTDETGSRWLGQMELITGAQGTIAGHIDWTVSGGGHNGLSGHESVSATFDPATRAVRITIESGAFNPGTYTAVLSEDGMRLEQGVRFVSGTRTGHWQARRVVAPAAPAISQADAARRAAEWVIARRGLLEVTVDSRTTQVRKATQLPTGPFALKEVLFPVLKGDEAQLSFLAEPGFRDLEAFQVRAVPLTDAALVNFQGLRRLKSVRLAASRITDAGMATLAKLPALIELDVRDCDITDAGLVPLQGTLLIRLFLDHTAITDEGLAHLEKLTTLTELFLPHTRIGDQGLTHLAKLPKLKSLTIRGTKVTAAGVAALKQALPSCRIRWDDPSHPAGAKPTDDDDPDLRASSK